MKHQLTTIAAIFALGATVLTTTTQAQPWTLTGTNYSQNFDGLTASGLPGEWVLYTGASATLVGTINTAFKGGATNGWADTSGGFKNYASTFSYEGSTNYLGNESTTIQNAASNRALGVRPVSATDAGNAFVFKVADSVGFGQFVLDVDMLLLNAQPRSNNWQLDFGVSPDGSSPPTSFTVVSNNFFGTYTNTGAFGVFHRTLSFGSLLDNQPGPIWVRIWNTASIGSGSRPSVGIDNFNLTFTNVAPVVTPPAITTPPQSQTVYVGDTATLTVANSGTAPFTYQWYKDNFSTPVGSGAATLIMSPVSTNDAGDYYVVVSNSAGSDTNDSPAVLTVGTRIPISTTIYNIRTNQDVVNWSPLDITNHYTVTGVVISRTNMTTAGNASFYIEDTNSSCGIDVFIATDTTTRPAYGDVIQVTGPIGQFNGLLEFNFNSANPTHIVTNLGPSGYTVPAKALDFASVGDISLMETNLEGSLVVASSVYIQNGGTGTNYPGGSTLTLTNQSNQTFPLFIDSRLTDIIGQPIPGGLVNITGYISQFDSAAPFTSGYQLVPTHAGAIVAAPLAPSPESLTYTVSGTDLILSWTQLAFVLNSATDVTGPYTPVSGATSPYTNSLAGPQTFFRLIYP